MVSAGEEDWPNLTARLVQRIAELESRIFESEFDDSPVEADWWLEYPLKGLVCAMIGDRFARHTHFLHAKFRTLSKILISLCYENCIRNISISLIFVKL
jgi:hypothetical protein